MDAQEKVLAVMREANEPLNAGKIVEVNLQGVTLEIALQKLIDND